MNQELRIRPQGTQPPSLRKGRNTLQDRGDIEDFSAFSISKRSKTKEYMPGDNLIGSGALIQVRSEEQLSEQLEQELLSPDHSSLESPDNEHAGNYLPKFR